MNDIRRIFSFFQAHWLLTGIGLCALLLITVGGPDPSTVAFKAYRGWFWMVVALALALAYSIQRNRPHRARNFSDWAFRIFAGALLLQGAIYLDGRVHYVDRFIALLSSDATSSTSASLVSAAPAQPIALVPCGSPPIGQVAVCDLPAGGVEVPVSGKAAGLHLCLSPGVDAVNRDVNGITVGVFYRPQNGQVFNFKHGYFSGGSC